SGTIRLDFVAVTGTPIPGGNTAPFLNPVPATRTGAGNPGEPIILNGHDSETAAHQPIPASFRSKPAPLPNNSANIQLTGTGTNRALTLVPASGQTGIAPITLSLSDGTNHVSTMFPLVVVPSAAVLFCDYFSYPNGPLLSNSAFLWEHRAGV